MLCFIAFRFPRTPVKSRCSAAFSKASARERSPTKQYLWRHFLLFSRRSRALALLNAAQVKRAIWEGYITHTCGCVESLHYFAWFVSSKSSTIWLRSLYITLSLLCDVPRSHVPVLLAMQWSVAWRFAFYRGRKHLWIVFSFNKKHLYSRRKKNITLYAISTCNI